MSVQSASSNNVIVESDIVLLRFEGSIATITLNQPASLNALTLPMADTLYAVLQILCVRDGLRAIVLRGEGRAFMAGGDLGYLRESSVEAAPQEASHLIGRLNQILMLMTEMPVPIIASVHGAVAGAGNSLMLACDFAIAAEETRFVYAYAQIGASPDGGLSWLLPKTIGLRQAMAFAFIDNKIECIDAMRLGLINRVVKGEELIEATAAFAATLSKAPTLAFGRTKALMRQGFDKSLPQQLEDEREAFCASTQTDDFQEGINAFFERRLPDFEGC